jgi:hypothetical protein
MLLTLAISALSPLLISGQLFQSVGSMWQLGTLVAKEIEC